MQTKNTRTTTHSCKQNTISHTCTPHDTTDPARSTFHSQMPSTEAREPGASTHDNNARTSNPNPCQQFYTTSNAQMPRSSSTTQRPHHHPEQKMARHDTPGIQGHRTQRSESPTRTRLARSRKTHPRQGHNNALRETVHQDVHPNPVTTRNAEQRPALRTHVCALPERRPVHSTDPAIFSSTWSHRMGNIPKHTPSRCHRKTTESNPTKTIRIS